MACPTRARHFGDLGDAESAVWKLVAEREGYALMPEFGYAPVNRYLPPRPRRGGCGDTPPDRDALSVSERGKSASDALDPAQLPGVLRWLDRVLSR
jgi:hypothetical protein